MPTRPYTGMERAYAEALFEMGTAMSDSSSSDESLADYLIDEACEPFVRRRLQAIGPEHLSINRLRREATERGIINDDYSTSVYSCSVWTTFQRWSMFSMHQPASVPSAATCSLVRKASCCCFVAGVSRTRWIVLRGRRAAAARPSRRQWISRMGVWEYH